MECNLYIHDLFLTHKEHTFEGSTLRVFISHFLGVVKTTL
jgi:hypothetical protein